MSVSSGERLNGNRSQRNDAMHNGSNSDGNRDTEKQDERSKQKISLRGRLTHFTWAWFTFTMSTGGLSVVLGQTPKRFDGLNVIGDIVFIFDLVLFVCLCLLMTTRFILEPRRLWKSLTTGPECFFFGAFWLSIVTIIISIQLWGVTRGPEGTWLITAVRVLYWIYAACALIYTITQYFIFFTTTPLSDLEMNPAWFLPFYACMLTGTVASMIASSQPPLYRLPIIVSGAAYQGLGWMGSLITFVWYFGRLMQNGLPAPGMRPGMFIPVGFVGFTTTAFISLSRALPSGYAYFGAHPMAVMILQTVSLWFGIVVWIFGFWVFALAALSCVSAIPNMKFTLSWWAFIFPNVGFTLATIDIGMELGSNAILWVSSVMTILLVAMWLFTLGMCVQAVSRKQILWPGMDEDKEE